MTCQVWAVPLTRWSVTSLREPGERNCNAVSHKPKLTGTDWIELNWCPRWFMGYGIKISFPRPPQWRHRSPGIGRAAREVRFNQSEALLGHSDTSSVWQNFVLRFPSCTSFRVETSGDVSGFLRLKVTNCIESNHFYQSCIRKFSSQFATKSSISAQRRLGPSVWADMHNYVWSLATTKDVTRNQSLCTPERVPIFPWSIRSDK